MNVQRGLQLLPWRRLILPALAGLLTLVVGCGGNDPGAPLDDPKDIPGDTDPPGDPDPPPPPSVPELSAVNPSTGPPAGSTLVVLTGTGFVEDVTGETTVTFDGLEALAVDVVDDTTIHAITPTNQNNIYVDVRVENSNGDSVLAEGFHYLVTAHIISDLNSDGNPDVVVSAAYENSNGPYSGSVYVFYGDDPDQPLVDIPAGEADVKITGFAEGDRFGAMVATGDVNADGHTDLLVGAPRDDQVATDAGQVLVFLGPLPDSALMDGGEADIVFSGEGTVPGDLFGHVGDHFGAALSLGDVDGDGLVDVLVGAPGVDLEVGTPDELEDAGRVYLFLGSGALSDAAAADAALIISGAKKGAHLGSAVCAVDIDDDGYAELAVSGEVDSSVLYIGGYVYIFDSETLVSGTTSMARMRIAAENGGEQFGTALINGDVNGDGVEDLAASAPYSDALGSATGCVYVFLGHAGFDVSDASESDVIYFGQYGNAGFGSGLATADLNGDGYADIMIGAPRTSFGATKNGQVFAFYGSLVPSDELAYYCDILYTGEIINGGRFGSAIEVLDCDGDGLADLMSSAVGLDAAAGRVYVFRGATMPVDTEASNDDLTLTGESEGGNFGFSISRGK